MQTEVIARSFPLTDAMRRYVTRRVEFSLSIRRDHIKCVVVRLSDNNGPRGGTDKCCRIQVVVPGQADIVVQDTESDLYAAIDQASYRVGRTVARRLDRHRNFNRYRVTALPFVEDERADASH